jgi:UDP-N-acetylmuramoyl-tripeptide--D-alanyl-D-alanine ligase
MSPDKVHMFENNDEAIALLERVVKGDDVILVKGSRAMKMEEIVNALSRES